MSETIERFVRFDGCFNFRDLGGYINRDGRQVRRGLLFRADTLHRLSDDDITRFRSLGLSTVIDLRSLKEIEDFGVLRDEAHPADGRHHLPMMDFVDLRAVQARPASTPLDPPELVYARIFGSGAAVVTAIEVLSDQGNLPAVFHCTAGKDRTGILAAIVLDLLGVADEDIFADYDLTIAARERSMAWMAEHEPELAGQYRRLTPEMESRGRTGLTSLVRSLRESDGTIEAALLRLGAPPAALLRLREALLA